MKRAPPFFTLPKRRPDPISVAIWEARILFTPNLSPGRWVTNPLVGLESRSFQGLVHPGKITRKEWFPKALSFSKGTFLQVPWEKNPGCTKYMHSVLCFRLGGVGSLLYSLVRVIRLLGSTANVRSVWPCGVRLGTLACYQSSS